ncbi:hypothetical protein PXK00_12795 [Phaeobacter sp. QD34_3]|uniref:hypothetical protein n=1 Tax=unclassified Phaeobacter TaxID=2621772 RepID=UPI00237FC7E8|nr:MULTISPECIES: hypothetical protein [unclassified Phaeobacter]MDE4133994.1 hypothetical protein [Phaeobacter sp. QD34_3]MDE4137549.1 hypothetical protein [Phaeobacter sp. QD34_24]
MQPAASVTQAPLIEQVLRLFEAGDPAILTLLAEDIDFRIDHYKDDADTAWQQARGMGAFGPVLQRLGQEIFPQGTRIRDLTTKTLCDGWAVTRMEQEFFYPRRNGMVNSVTYIITHEEAGQIDYFRETVTTIDTI